MKIIIDPGHSGSDSGAVSKGAIEKDINLSIALFLQYELLLKNYEVFLTRTDDKTLSLPDRCGIANIMKADLFISIHCDAFNTERPSGMTVFKFPSAKHNLAECIQTELARDFQTHIQRGVKEERFYVLRKTKMPSVLIECEFITNTDGREFLLRPENHVNLAHSIANGIEAFQTDGAPQQAHSIDNKKVVAICSKCGMEHHSHMSAANCCR